MNNRARSPEEALDDLGMHEVLTEDLGDDFYAKDSTDPSRGNGAAPGTAAPGAETLPKFELHSFDDIQLGTEPFYLVKGIIPRTGLVDIWGPPKCGKSFITFDMMMCVVRGCPYRGRRTQQGTIVYCALEGAMGFKARIEAYRQRHLPEGKSRCPFYLIDTPMRLVDDKRALITSIKVQIGDQLPAAIVIDTLNRSITGSESNDKDMGAYLRAADALRCAFGCVVILIHHCGIDDSRPRGHTSLPGNVDAQIAVKRDAGGVILATVEYMKDGPEGECFASCLEPVTVGVDDDGEAITSCVVVPVEGVTVKLGPKKKRLPASQRIAMDALIEAINDFGVSAPVSPYIPKVVQVVTADQWQEYAYRRGISPKGTEDAKRKAFKRAMRDLQAGHHVGICENYVWLTPHQPDGGTAAGPKGLTLTSGSRS